MPAQDEWIVFLESNPVYWKISQSKIMVNLLKEFVSGALSLEALYFKNPKMPLPELEEILSTFVSAKLVVKRMLAGTIVFALTAEGKKFLELYKKTEKSFTIK